MSPSRQCVCMHISDPGRDRHKDKYIQHTHTHTQMYRHRHREREYPLRIIRSVMLSNSDPPTKLEHHDCDTSIVI